VDDDRLQAVVEALLFAAGEPVTLARLEDAIGEVPRERIRATLSRLASEYSGGGRGFVLEEVAGGFQLRTRKELASYVRRLLAAKPPRLSRPFLETLAIIAYRQPITRPEIEHLRGVDSGAVLDTLLERRLVRIAGRKDAPGRPLIYATTPEFLEAFGLKDLESLPDLKEFQELERPELEDDAADVVASGAASEVAQPESPAAPGQPPGVDTPRDPKPTD
jgi:segregation and condensation protein B